jgi:hypothetical protein
MTDTPAPLAQALAPPGAEAVAPPPVSESAKLSPADAAAPPHPAVQNRSASPSIPQPPSNSNDGSQEQPSKVAFTATLKPADSSPEQLSPSAAPTLFPTEPPAPPPNPQSPASDDLAPPNEKNSRPTVTPGSKQLNMDSAQPRKAAETGAPPPEAAGVSQTLPNPVGPQDSQPPASSGSSVHTAAPQAPAPASTPQAGSPDEPAHTAAAHDIKLQVAGDGEQRVEVRITERGGDVFVAVRTPDSRLAGDLRQNLPALATRLEQSGFHATTWQPGASGARERIADPQSGAAGQDSQSQARQNGREQQRDRQEQKPKSAPNPASAAESGQPGRDFASLLSAVR